MDQSVVSVPVGMLPTMDKRLADNHVATTEDPVSLGGTRSDGDSWDLASSVGATATMSAAARAIATREDPSFFSDSFAEPLVRAVGIEFLTRLASGELPTDGLVEPTWVEVGKVRGRFYDEFFGTAANAGITQAVIMAAGLDSRAYRLAWPDAAVVYEIDQSRVIEFKTHAMAKLGALPTAERRVVPADLRDDWPRALIEVGFDRTRPTAWSAEGLLGYLPPDSQDELLTTITEYSAPGSRVATESRPYPRAGQSEATKARLVQMTERWRAHGFAPDLAGTRYDGHRNEAAPYLAALGWETHTHSIGELLATHDLDSLVDDDLRVGDTLLVTGIRPKPTGGQLPCLTRSESRQAASLPRCRK